MCIRKELIAVLLIATAVGVAAFLARLDRRSYHIPVAPSEEKAEKLYTRIEDRKIDGEVLAKLMAHAQLHQDGELFVHALVTMRRDAKAQQDDYSWLVIHDKHNEEYLKKCISNIAANIATYSEILEDFQESRRSLPDRSDPRYTAELRKCFATSLAGKIFLDEEPAE